jgi:two-component system copper resistance phosphate regulon response regulator CusR
MRLLVVEDDRMTRDFVTRVLLESGFGVDATALASEAEKMALQGAHDALIVDLMLPDRDGLELIQRLRAQGVSAPVLILSARRSVDERVLGLDKGGDDYMTKPFAVAELLARVRALLRRTTPAQPEAIRLRAGVLELDLIRREARRDGLEIQLTQQEFALLEYLCRNAGRVVTRAMVLDHVWKMRIDTSTNIVDVHIHRLRGKIDKNAQHPLIQTIRGVGYILTDITSYQ